MAFQTVFKRYEFKYMITREQKKRILERMEPYMKIDEFGRTTIRNLYFDTEHYLLVRRSIEKPTYKEKLRIRSYHQATPESMVFVELKKKYKSVVYKRRLSLPCHEAMQWILENKPRDNPTQISDEIDYAINHYGTLFPRVFLSYEREAYYTKKKSDFRVTFDENILARQEDLSLESGVYGTPLLPEDKIMMEIKCSGGIPLWMTEILSLEKIYRTSFSKYGTAYRNFIHPQQHLNYLK